MGHTFDLYMHPLRFATSSRHEHSLSLFGSIPSFSICAVFCSLFAFPRAFPVSYSNRFVLQFLFRYCFIIVCVGTLNLYLCWALLALNFMALFSPQHTFYYFCFLIIFI
ncbi:hypothetical protein HOY80DRAFT_273640 [Tuber brumale]|nr:hypothetical protein HOY80DRAFT_273640 [Tuber brumale]